MQRKTAKPKTDLMFGARFEPDLFWEQHGSKLIVGGLLIIVLGLAASYWVWHRSRALELANARLAAATDEQSLQAILRDYPGQPVAVAAALRLADWYYAQGNFSAAASQYERILTDNPDHPFRESAELGIAASLEAEGRFEAAADRYREILRRYPDGYGRTVAKLGLARCTEALGNFTEARQLYEEVSATAPGTAWQEEANLRLTVLDRQHPRPPRPMAAPVVSVPEPDPSPDADPEPPDSGGDNLE
jgi:tetratricopeptide (TPR) repeat protein